MTRLNKAEHEVVETAVGEKTKLLDNDEQLDLSDEGKMIEGN